MKKILFITILAAGIGLLGWQVYQKASASKKDSNRQRGNVPVAVEIAPIKKSTIQDVGDFTGSLYPLSEFIVAPKIGGRLEKILVHIGDTVKSGQLVARLDDEEYRQQVSQAKAELEVAQANLQERKNILENAKREYDRTVALSKKKIASESQLDAAGSEYKTQQSKLKVASAQVSQKEAELRMADVRLSYGEIRLPKNNASGFSVVGERFVDEGAMLAPNTPIVSIIDIGKLIAAISVIERDYTKIHPGLESMITTDAFPGRRFSGKVIRVAPLLKEKSREARVEIEIPNEEKLLKPGMFIKVQIRFDQHENATVVPEGAIIKRNGAQGLFLADLEQRKAKFVEITVGIIHNAQAEIIAPPLTGAVVTLGHHLLQDGGSIILPAEKPRTGPQQKDEKPRASQKEDKPVVPQDTGKPGIKRGKVQSEGKKS
ncbi:MAG TPA: efflux RND transporter periplasmic adaptor subunit [Deltaproteobacteria bacterium]|nr:efflux RND transporter periplasmic adaptor subunit [Deltaproteobacteria bacterium]